MWVPDLPTRTILPSGCTRTTVARSFVGLSAVPKLVVTRPSPLGPKLPSRVPSGRRRARANEVRWAGLGAGAAAPATSKLPWASGGAAPGSPAPPAESPGGRHGLVVATREVNGDAPPRPETRVQMPVAGILGDDEVLALEGAARRVADREDRVRRPRPGHGHHRPGRRPRAEEVLLNPAVAVEGAVQGPVGPENGHGEFAVGAGGSARRAGDHDPAVAVQGDPMEFGGRAEEKLLVTCAWVEEGAVHTAVGVEAGDVRPHGRQVAGV